MCDLITTELLEENVLEALKNIGIGKDVLEKTPQAQEIKTKK